MKPSYRMEPLSETLQVCVSPEHGFGTDAFLLTDFSRYRRKDLVCDLGTGCGIIPMIMQRQDPPKQVYGVDIQPQAIEQFQQSVQASGVVHGAAAAFVPANEPVRGEKAEADGQAARESAKE